MTTPPDEKRLQIIILSCITQSYIVLSSVIFQSTGGISAELQNVVKHTQNGSSGVFSSNELSWGFKKNNKQNKTDMSSKLYENLTTRVFWIRFWGFKPGSKTDLSRERILGDGRWCESAIVVVAVVPIDSRAVCRSHLPLCDAVATTAKHICRTIKDSGWPIWIKTLVLHSKRSTVAVTDARSILPDASLVLPPARGTVIRCKTLGKKYFTQSTSYVRTKCSMILIYFLPIYT